MKQLCWRSVCLVIVSASAWILGTSPVFAHHHHHGSHGSSGGSWGSNGSSGGSYGSSGGSSGGSYGSSGGSYGSSGGSSGGSYGSSGGSWGSHGSSGGSWGSNGSSGGSSGSSGSSGGSYAAAAAAPAPTTTAQNTGRAWLLISVPQNAVVYLQNQRMSLPGTERQFYSAPVAADKEFVYTVRVDVPSGDRVVSKVSTVRVKANRNVRFTLGEQEIRELAAKMKPSGRS